mmetsp:Transcript_1001/g.3852  ORF Transcript_1001/g.3852 Transcript_1001/m.3852 type:complete len:223 (-) Transcript_1001:239-907(-)
MRRRWAPAPAPLPPPMASLRASSSMARFTRSAADPWHTVFTACLRRDRRLLRAVRRGRLAKSNPSRAAQGSTSHGGSASIDGGGTGKLRALSPKPNTLNPGVLGELRAPLTKPWGAPKAWGAPKPWGARGAPRTSPPSRARQSSSCPRCPRARAAARRWWSRTCRGGSPLSRGPSTRRRPGSRGRSFSVGARVRSQLMCPEALSRAPEREIRHEGRRAAPVP